MKTISRNIFIYSSPEKVFATLDNLSVTGMHMTKSSAMMMGSKLHLQYLTEHRTGLGTKYRWTGSMLGMKMDFTVEVTAWDKAKEKTWETVGQSRMIIYSWYRMHFLLKPVNDRTETILSITYKRPEGWFSKLISFLFANWYCNWCLKKMLGDTKRILEAMNHSVNE